MKGRTLPCILLGIATALLCCYCVLITKTLVLSGENEQIFLKVPVWDGTQFSVTFIHSVHKSPLTDYYEIHGKDIYVIKTKYFDFGAGVQTELWWNVDQWLSSKDESTHLCCGNGQRPHP